MIFLTVGTQLPFDRLARAMDEVAARIEERVIGQIGSTDFRPVAYEATAQMPPDRFAELLRAARVVVAHAGTGTILAAMRQEKPLILMPRRSALGEHRNDHQVHTCAWMAKARGAYVAESADQILRLLASDLAPMQDADSPRRRQLIERIRSELAGMAARPRRPA